MLERLGVLRLALEPRRGVGIVRLAHVVHLQRAQTSLRAFCEIDGVHVPLAEHRFTDSRRSRRRDQENCRPRARPSRSFQLGSVRRTCAGDLRFVQARQRVVHLELVVVAAALEQPVDAHVCERAHDVLKRRLKDALSIERAETGQERHQRV